MSDGLEPKEDISLKSIFNQCMDSGGYVLLAGHLTGEKNESGESVISWEYRRYHFPLEDARQGIEKLRGFVDDEYKKMFSGDGGGI